MFRQDLNSDGQIGPTTTTIEAFGFTRLDHIANQFFLQDSAGDSSSLKYDGSAVVPGQFGGWTPIGAEEVASGYLVAWKNGASDEYTVWNTDAQGNHLGDAIGVVSGYSADLEVLELNFQQDLNGDGTVGPTNVVSANGQANAVDGGSSGSADLVLLTSANDGVTSDPALGGTADLNAAGKGGKDWIIGGAGADVVGDFRHGVDKFDFTNIAGINAAKGIPTFQGNITGEGNLTLNAHSVAYLEVGGNTMVLVNTSSAAETVATSDTHAADMSITLLGVHLGLTGSDFHHV
jgi:hypothetical protein